MPDTLPTEPGGYTGYQALFGHKYVAPQCWGGHRRTLTHNGYPVTDASGNLTDLNGNALINTFANKPGFPGFSPTATQSLAYLADMQESGIPVTYGYISDLHERKAGTSGCTTAPATGSGKPLGPGDSCYVANAKAYDAAFATFFQRLATDGITPANTEFVISAEENDQFAGANIGRATQPTPAGCDGVTVACSYTATPDRRAAGQHQGPAVDHGQRRHRVRHRAAGRVDLRARPAGRPATRRCGSCSATPPR